MFDLIDVCMQSARNRATQVSLENAMGGRAKETKISRTL
jgi:hypothetical protein